MTEEIIIDGVDVAGCKFYDKRAVLYDCTEDTTSGDNNCYRCKDEPNCYYKQLKRLEQENKELKEWKERVVKLFESACRCKYLNEEKDICSYTNEKCININKCVYKYQELSDTYRSALEEIRTYLNTLSSIDSDFTNTETYLRIQDKINEVLK